MKTRIQGLDALRFLCALCVVQGHLRLGGYLVLDKLRGPATLITDIRIAFNQGFPVPTGPNAVIVFFVISGFCIHFPQRHTLTLAVPQFWVRRYLRVGLPALVAAVALYLTGFHSLQDSVLWSVICELIYYSLYPLLLLLRRRVGWLALIAAGYALAFLVIQTHDGGRYNGNFTAFGAGVTWILGLPCWLLGCLLAERYQRFAVRSTPSQWLLRLAIIGAAAIGTTMRFYDHVGYYWSEPLLAILLYGWLGSEIVYFTVHSPWAWLESAGRWSYSVYLFHAPTSILIGHLVGMQFGMSVKLLLEVAGLLLGSYALYRLVERPAHQLARHLYVTDRTLHLAVSAKGTS